MYKCKAGRHPPLTSSSQIPPPCRAIVYTEKAAGITGMDQEIAAYLLCSKHMSITAESKSLGSALHPDPWEVCYGIHSFRQSLAHVSCVSVICLRVPNPHQLSDHKGWFILSGVFLTGAGRFNQESFEPYLACRTGRHLHLKWPSKQVSAWPCTTNLSLKAMSGWAGVQRSSI